MKYAFKNLVMLLLAVSFSMQSASMQSAEAANVKPKLQVPDGTYIAILIYTTTAALNNANVAGNYSVLRDMASPQFRNVNSSARLAEIFSSHRKNNLNLAAALLYQPYLEQNAFIDKRGLLQLKGFYDTAPKRLKFHFSYQFTPYGWKLYGLNVRLHKR